MNIKLSGESLRLLRLTKGAKQCSVAKRLGISQPAYSKYEKRESLDEEKTKKILHALNCNEKDLELILQIREVRYQESFVRSN